MNEVPENAVATAIVDAALMVHRALGPGLLESAYEVALAFELTRRGHTAERQVSIPISYDGVSLGEGFRADLIVDRLVIVELKSLERLADVHRKQTNTYVRLGGFRLGLLINFGGERLKDGIVRIANGLPEGAATR